LGPDRHVGPGHLESGRLAVIGIGDRLTLASFDVIEQQAELGGAIGRPHRLERGQSLEIDRDDMTEALKILACHLPRAIEADVDAMSIRHGLSAPIRWFAQMPVTDAGGVNFDIEADPYDLGAERDFREGRAADIAKTDEQHGRFSGHVLRSSLVLERYDVLNRVPEKMLKSAVRFVPILNRARTLIRREHFQNWQVALPGVWKQWENDELNGGFHAVIGNPPYVRQELIKEYKPALKRAFAATYDGSADLYIYFYEQGLKLLRPGGRLSYVVTNKWMRAGYAEGLRELFADKAWLEFVADFGHAKNFFPDADVFPSVVVVRKPNDSAAPVDTQVCVIPRDDVPEKGLDAALAKATYPLLRIHFTKENWTLEPPAVVALLDKIKKNGVPLKDFAGVEPFYGIKTGLNEAFLINTAARNDLVAEDPSLTTIIKPYLRGQDIDRWSCADSGLFMIMMKSSGDYQWPWSDAPDEVEAERRFAIAYPGLYRQFKKLEQFKDPKTGSISDWSAA
jgi:Eco57I restriction-modification methylase